MTTKVLHSYLTFAKRAFKKKTGFYLDLKKNPNFGLKSAKIHIFFKKIQTLVSKLSDESYLTTNSFPDQ